MLHLQHVDLLHQNLMRKSKECDNFLPKTSFQCSAGKSELSMLEN